MYKRHSNSIDTTKQVILTNAASFISTQQSPLFMSEVHAEYIASVAGARVIFPVNCFSGRVRAVA